MHDPSLTSAAALARRGGREALAEALLASRADTLATFADYRRALPGLQVPMRAGLNPPLWELGHVGWFQDFWIARNPQRGRGTAADPEAPRSPCARADSDRLYDSGRVEHDSRWRLPLPDAEATLDDLARQLERTLALLRGSERDDDDTLYFFRLALLHEDMHHEAALYMAQSLGIRITDPAWQPRAIPEPGRPLGFEAGTWRLGGGTDGGFAFDNERPPTLVPVSACSIDAQVVRWAEFVPFIEDGGSTPRDLRRASNGWQRRRQGAWEDLRLDEAACHLSLREAEAWCRWAGRRLPTEAEWEQAAVMCPDAFRWGDVWEWTASLFGPHPGFAAHPYRDYSAPWFDGRRVLRGASFMTQPRMRHPCYRNFFEAHRDDVPAGFRTCAA